MASLICMPVLEQCGAYNDPLSSLFAVILMSFLYYGGTMRSNIRVWMCMYHTGQLLSNDNNKLMLGSSFRCGIT